MKIADLPYDMQVLLGQWAIESGKLRMKSFDRFVERDLPVRMIRVGRFPDLNPLEQKGDPYFEAYAKTPYDEYPPLVVAHGYFLDGQHRLYAARVQGAAEVAALDATSITTKKFIKLFGSLGRMG